MKVDVKGTVFLSVEKYNELRDFKKEVEESSNGTKFAVIEQRDAIFGTKITRKYYTENEAILDFENRNKELKAENKELKAENKELRDKIEKSKVISISDLNKMSYWKFRKLRKS